MRASKLLAQLTDLLSGHRACSCSSRVKLWPGLARLSADRRRRAADHASRPRIRSRQAKRSAPRMSAISARACSGWSSRSSARCSPRLPVSWVYMAVRSGDEYDQSLVNTILVLPMVVTGIVIIVQNSLALAFSLAGIAGAVRFRNSLKSSGDALFILLRGGDRTCRRGSARSSSPPSSASRFNYMLRAAVDDRIWRAQGDEALPRRL